MLYVKAFIACGLIGLILQIVMANTRIGFVRLFTAALCAGVLLTLVGLMKYIVGFGMGGVLITVAAAGDAVYTGFMNAFEGNFEVMFEFWGLLFSIIAMSVGSGLAVGARLRAKSKHLSRSRLKKNSQLLP